MQELVFCLESFAGLSGMKSEEFNGRLGKVVSINRSTGRFGIALHGDPAQKSIKRENLIQYVPCMTDICSLCSPFWHANAARVPLL